MSLPSHLIQVTDMYSCKKFNNELKGQLCNNPFALAKHPFIAN